MRLSHQSRVNRIACALLVSLLVFMRAVYSEPVKPFWTEKSSYIEGDKLYVVGIASNADSIEAGRMQAFANGKSEIMNFTQISNLEGLVISTQMTYEEEFANKFDVYRLMYVDYEQINLLKNRRIEQAEKNYERFQQKQQQEITVKRNALNRLNKNREEIAFLDKEYYRIVNDVNGTSDRALRYVRVGMSRSEVESLLGLPRAIYKHYDGYVYDAKYGEYWVIFDHADTVVCLSTAKKCIYKNCNDEYTRCAHQGDVSHYNRMRKLD